MQVFLKLHINPVHMFDHVWPLCWNMCYQLTTHVNPTLRAYNSVITLCSEISMQEYTLTLYIWMIMFDRDRVEICVIKLTVHVNQTLRA